jgi:hypothetical protein
MSALRALDAARAASIEVRLDGKDLVLSGASTPPTAVIDMLRRHKHSIVELLRQRYIAGTSVPASAGAVAALGAGTGGTGSTLVSASGDIIGSSNIIGSDGISASSDIVALRRPQGDEWSTEDWQAYFDERAAIAEFDGGLSRPEAEKRAVEHCISEWLYQHPMSSDAKDGCLACGETDRPSDGLLPVGLGGGQVWLHRGCSSAWRTARIAEAVAALAAIGIKGSRSSSP